jgi:7-cyano-7-deazaguanine synthase
MFGAVALRSACRLWLRSTQCTGPWAEASRYRSANAERCHKLQNVSLYQLGNRCTSTWNNGDQHPSVCFTGDVLSLQAGLNTRFTADRASSALHSRFGSVRGASSLTPPRSASRGLAQGQAGVQNGAVAIVLLSGGLDSATTLAIARSQGFICKALSFDYGQRHRCELEAARRVARAQQVTGQHWIRLDLGSIGGSALTAPDIPVPKAANVDDVWEHTPETIPLTYVPARNTIFLAYALALAEVQGSYDIFIGANAVDYSGYPDCRPEFFHAFERVAELGTRAGVAPSGARRFRIHAPLLQMPKIEIIRTGLALGVDYSITHSCYDPLDESGKPCRRCDACRIRHTAFRELGLEDPQLSRFGAGSAAAPRTAKSE